MEGGGGGNGGNPLFSPVCFRNDPFLVGSAHFSPGVPSREEEKSQISDRRGSLLARAEISRFLRLFAAMDWLCQEFP